MKKTILTHTLKNKTWFFCPVTILDQNDDYIIFRINIGTPTFRATDKHGFNCRLDVEDWTLSRKIWTTHNLTYLVPFQGNIGYGVLTDQNNQTVEYYLNFQEELQIKHGVINTMDLELDFVIEDYNTNTYYWKDEDEFNYLISKKVFRKELVSSLIRDEKTLIKLFEDYKFQLDQASLKNVKTVRLDELHQYIPNDVDRRIL